MTVLFSQDFIVLTKMSVDKNIQPQYCGTGNDSNSEKQLLLLSETELADILVYF